MAGLADAPRVPLPSPLPPRLREAARRRILDISEYYAATSGGVRTYLHEKARYVASRNHLAGSIVVPAAQDELAELDGVRLYRLRGPLIPFQGTYRLFGSGAALRSVMRHEAPDLIEVGSAYAAPWLVLREARAAGVPTVWFYHGHLPRIVAPRGAASSIARRALSAAVMRYVRAIARRVDAVLVASDAVRDELEREGVRNARRVPLGVDTTLFHPDRRMHRRAVRASLGLGEGPVMLYSGRLTAEKELDVVAAAWPLLRHDRATLLLVGEGTRADRLAARHHRIRVLPFESDRARVADLCAAADIYVAPGPAETFGLSAHEAMAAGTPVLSVDTGAVAEQVRRSGAGATYATGSPAACAAALDTLLDEDRAALGARARAFIERHHAWEVAFDRIFAVYDDVIAGRA